ncbi:hypothetical protein [Sphingomonas sp. PAMC 26621]|uniref:hypothetical protein n=1 Tax=Sphingomonas sp. PAMC 26621 TaxID=1112213 RepID=UPI000288D3E7
MILNAKTLIGVAAGAAAITSASAQQVELVPFRSVDDGVVIEVGKKPVANEIPPVLPTDATLISTVACEAGVPVGLFDALVAQESQYNPLIVSPKVRWASRS